MKLKCEKNCEKCYGCRQFRTFPKKSDLVWMGCLVILTTAVLTYLVARGMLSFLGQ